MVAPIIPKATRYQGERRFPVKKVSEVAFRDEKYETTIRSPKNPTITINARVVLILYLLLK
jgi:hypothetical protein